MSLGPLSALTASGQSAVPQATTETIPYAIDMTAALPSGGSVSTPSSVMVDLETGQTISLADSPTVAGNVVTQIVRGSALAKNHSYRLTVTFTAGVNTVLTVAMEIDVASF